MDGIVPEGQKRFPRESQLERGHGYLIALQRENKQTHSGISEREVLLRPGQSE